MIIIGDVHGHFGAYELLCDRFTDETTVQLGDMGVGFPNDSRPVIKGKDYFFRGNHDNPEVANSYGNCLGDYGFQVLDGTPFFFVAGAWSIDQWARTEGVSWWRDEELSIASLEAALDLYASTTPDIVITHDAPQDAARLLLNRFDIQGTNPAPLIQTRTGQALQSMFEIHQPKLWVFGHYHVDWTKEVNGTTFRCLNELSWMRI